MRKLIAILILAHAISCSSSTDKEGEIEHVIKGTKNAKVTPIEQASVFRDSTGIPPDGTYRYDIAFAEWNGDSMGEKITVEIKGDSVKVIYEGDGQLSLTESGGVIDEGILRKHKSGKWIIAKSESDTEIHEIGGCAGGPSVIDFKNKKFWMC